MTVGITDLFQCQCRLQKVALAISEMKCSGGNKDCNVYKEGDNDKVVECVDYKN